ncbi:MerR family transcriptional regulator [Plantactinospora sonchi]|uniref:MerR family transcriptional regulator n=1 Tax=Plantactinospora sonchi TaxID=1544735 RepID=A0ABU7RNS4_9ACTN
MSEPLLDIAEVAERAGVTPSALRFYERRALISPAGRRGLRRTYRADVLERLTFIACAQNAGFTIAEIARFLVSTPDDSQIRTRMAEKARELEENIQRLNRMRASLEHASTCMHELLVECPAFRAALARPRTGDSALADLPATDAESAA